MPREPIELPPAVARRFVEDMRALQLGSGLFQAETNGWRGSALGAIGHAAARAENGYERLAGIAARGTIGLHHADIRCGCFAFCALFALGSLRTLSPLWTRYALDSLRTLGACRTLWTCVAFRAGIAAATGQGHGNTYGDNRSPLH